MAEGLQRCKSRHCPRLVSVGTDHCCAACALAHEGRYEIHEQEALAHSEGCNERHAERSKDWAPHTKCTCRNIVALGKGPFAAGNWVTREHPACGREPNRVYAMSGQEPPANA